MDPLVQALRAEIDVLRRELCDARARIAHLEGDKVDVMTVEQAAAAALCDRQTIRNWVAKAGIGKYSSEAGRYLISRRRLRDYVIRRFGKAPPGLRAVA